MCLGSSIYSRLVARISLLPETGVNSARLVCVWALFIEGGLEGNQSLEATGCKRLASWARSAYHAFLKLTRSLFSNHFYPLLSYKIIGYRALPINIRSFIIKLHIKI